MSSLLCSPCVRENWICCLAAERSSERSSQGSSGASDVYTALLYHALNELVVPIQAHDDAFVLRRPREVVASLQEESSNRLDVVRNHACEGIPSVELARLERKRTIDANVEEVGDEVEAVGSPGLDL